MSPDDLILIEEWRDGASPTAHFSSANFATFSDRCDPRSRGSPSITNYDIASTSPLFGCAPTRAVRGLIAPAQM
jgi:quinol monooxygenase YgiN